MQTQTQNKFRAPISPIKSLDTSAIIHKRGKVLTRDVIVRNIEEKHKIEDIVTSFRLNKTSNRVANVRKTKAGFRIIGFDERPQTKEELSVFLKANGYNKKRFGGTVSAA